MLGGPQRSRGPVNVAKSSRRACTNRAPIARIRLAKFELAAFFFECSSARTRSRPGELFLQAATSGLCAPKWSGPRDPKRDLDRSSDGRGHVHDEHRNAAPPRTPMFFWSFWSRRVARSLASTRATYSASAARCATESCCSRRRCSPLDRRPGTGSACCKARRRAFRRSPNGSSRRG